MRDESANVRDGGRRHRRPRDPGARRRARVAGAWSCSAIHWNAARPGIETGPGREFSDRVDRDRRIEERRAAANAFDARGTSLERVAGGADAGSRETSGGLFDGWIRRG